jgi:hypothetical protein
VATARLASLGWDRGARDEVVGGRRYLGFLPGLAVDRLALVPWLQEGFTPIVETVDVR